MKDAVKKQLSVSNIQNYAKLSNGCCKIALDKAQILNATLNTVNTMSDISQLTCSRDVGRPTKT